MTAIKVLPFVNKGVLRCPTLEGALFFEINNNNSEAS